MSKDRNLVLVVDDDLEDAEGNKAAAPAARRRTHPVFVCAGFQMSRRLREGGLCHSRSRRDMLKTKRVVRPYIDDIPFRPNRYRQRD